MSVREQFLKRASAFKLTPYAIDGMDADCFIRPMDKGTRSRIESLASGNKTPKVCSDIRWVVLSNCFVDEEGQSILKKSDRELFDSWDDSLIEPLFESIMLASNVTEADRDAFEKN